MRAVLSGRVPPLDGAAEDLRWWHALSRNNTIDCGKKMPSQLC